MDESRDVAARKETKNLTEDDGEYFPYRWPERITLDPDDFDRFVAGCLSPPPLSPKLIEAMKFAKERGFK